jgi:hypothetical protein
MNLRIRYLLITVYNKKKSQVNSIKYCTSISEEWVQEK